MMLNTNNRGGGGDLPIVNNFQKILDDYITV